MEETQVKQIMSEALKKWSHFTDEIDIQARDTWLRTAVPLRVAFLEAAYSTQTKMHGDLSDICRHISNIANIDDRIKNGDLSVVDEIANFTAAKGHRKGQQVCIFSFATKYCSFGNPDVFPIYDRLARKGIRYFDEDKNNGFKKSDDLKRSQDWHRVIRAFMARFNLIKERLLNVDTLLTFVGNNKTDPNWFVRVQK